MQVAIYGWDSTNSEPVKVSVDAAGVLQVADPPPEEEDD